MQKGIGWWAARFVVWALMGLSSRTAAQEVGPFFFLANDAPAVELAEAIADHYSVSVLVHDSLASKKVTGRLVAHSLHEALGAVSFLLNCKFRSDDSKSA